MWIRLKQRNLINQDALMTKSCPCVSKLYLLSLLDAKKTKQRLMYAQMTINQCVTQPPNMIDLKTIAGTNKRRSLMIQHANI